MIKMTNEAERLQILEMIEKGVISAEEGVRLLNSLQEVAGEAAIPLKTEIPSETEQPARIPPEPEVVEAFPFSESKSETPPYDLDAEVKKWRRWWWIPLTVGISITVVSGLLMVLAYQNSGFGFWFACLWFPLFLGVIVISLSAASRTTRWLHVRIQQEPGEWPHTIAISMPLPVRFLAWLLRIFRPYIHDWHGMGNTSLDELIIALERISPNQPFYVRVDEGESGERVEVYIG
jgi:SHOCT-like domain